MSPMLALHRELDDAGPSITWTRRANNQPEFLEAIDGRGHGATRQAHLVLDLGYGKRALCNRASSAAKSVRQQPRVGDTLLHEEAQRTITLGNHQPEPRCCNAITLFLMFPQSGSLRTGLSTDPAVRWGRQQAIEGSCSCASNHQKGRSCQQ